MSFKTKFETYKNYITNSNDLLYPIKVTIFQNQSHCYFRVHIKRANQPLYFKAPTLKELLKKVKELFPNSKFIKLRNFEKFQKSVLTKSKSTSFLSFQKKILRKWGAPSWGFAEIIKTAYPPKNFFDEDNYDEDTQV